MPLSIHDHKLPHVIFRAVRLFAILLTAGMFTSPVEATTGPGSSIAGKKILFRRALPPSAPRLAEGRHEFSIRLYTNDGALVHEEKVTSDVSGDEFDIVLGSSKPLTLDITTEVILAISGNGLSDRLRTRLDQGSLLDESISGTITERAVSPLTPNLINAAAVERYAAAHGLISVPLARMISLIAPVESHLTGLKLEMALATPHAERVQGYYEAAKYGRINVELNNFVTIDGSKFGIAGQAMHVAHHLLLYAGGITTDINGDGMFMFTLGAAHYQTGNARWEPFVNAPFMRFKFHSTPKDIFLYSEIETTMHFRAMLTGTVGVGFRISPMVKVIGGLHHTEFVQPTERQIRLIRGFHGIINWGL
jgi:hypothetical protein